MGRKKKQKLWEFPHLPRFAVSVRTETIRSVYAIAAGLAALLFLLAPLNLGGSAGSFLYGGFRSLFGFGYFLIPISLALVAVGLMRESDEGVGTARLVGATLLFVSGIAIIGLVHEGGGGSVGAVVMAPFVALFDTLLGGIILAALAVVGVILALDTPLSLPRFPLFQKEKETDAPLTISGTAEEEGSEEIEEAEEKEAEEKEEKAEESAPVKRKKEEENEDIRAASFAPIDYTYHAPPVSLLERDRGKPAVGDIKANANIIKRTLQNFGIVVEMDEVSIGPTVTRYALKPAEGVRLQKILGLQNNLELALAASPVRIEAPIPGKSLVGIEVPNTKKATVGLASLLSEKAFTAEAKPLIAALGKDITGISHFTNIAKLPHLLIAGATGSGKSVSIHALLTSLLYRNGPATLRLILIDPKRVELTLYNPVPHLLTPVITEPKKAILALKWAGKEMERRYQLLESHSVRDIQSYHENVVRAHSGEDAPDQMPYIVIVIDELADIMQSYPRELEAAVVRLAQMSRAVGIHLVLSTQRPSVNVITGLIKANVPARIALQVASQIDSRTIIDQPGAEKLLGAGDMLYLSGDMSKPHRIQTAFISETEVKKVVEYIKQHNEVSADEIILSGQPSDAPNALFSASLEEGDDDLYAEAKSIVEEAGKASTSFLQRKLRVGYARAARLIDLLEERGVIGPGDGAKPREVLNAAPQGGYDPDET